MGERGREGVLRRAVRTITDQVGEARRAAVERTSTKYPDVYPPGYTGRRATDDE